MPAVSLCPDQDELRLYLMGTLPESDVEKVETHVSECEICVAILSELQAVDPFESAIRKAVVHQGASPNPDDDRLVACIVDSLDSRSQGIASTLSRSTSRPTDLDLSWLSPPQADDELGRVGIFRVLHVIGQGGMGVVFEAEDSTLQRRLALKVMLPKAAADPDGAARFLREARAVAKVRHPNVVTVYQADRFGIVPFIAMELLHGESLHDRLHRVGQLPLKDVLNLGRQITLGLAAAHAQGLLHRDIKPANIWLEQSEGGNVIAKVLDFGLARSVEGDGSLTQSGMIVGTPQYMAPEQARGATPTVRSDLFSLGCVLYQMTTGRLPFVGRNVLDQLRALAVDVPPPVSELRDNAPSDLSWLIHQLLEKVTSSRPASATDVAERLLEIAVPQVQPQPLRRWSRQRWAFVATAFFVVLAIVGISLRGDRPIGDPTHLTSLSSATRQAVVPDKPDAVPSSPQFKPTSEPVDSPSSQPKLDTLTTQSVHRLSDGNKPGDEWNDNGLLTKFCWCLPGTFMMGSPPQEPDRRPDEAQVAVTLSTGFWIGKYEVTEREWQLVMELEPRGSSTVGKRSDGRIVPSFPKTILGYDDAIEFCLKLTDRERQTGRLPVEWEYQLPTEAQWEYACRAGTKTATAFGNNLSSYQSNCWGSGEGAYNGAPSGPYLQRVSEVGSYAPNAWGIHDMHGNVWEWCRDAYSAKYPGGLDPVVTSPSSYRVGRGGAFNSFAGYCRSAIRSRSKPDSHGSGFRVAIVRRQLLVAKSEALSPTPRTMPATGSNETQLPKPIVASVSNEGDSKKVASVIPADVQLFWTGNDQQGHIFLKTAHLDGAEPTVVSKFEGKWGINDYADITIDEQLQRIYLALPRGAENHDCRIISFDYDGQRIREELRNNFVWSMCFDPTLRRLFVSGHLSGLFSVDATGADRITFNFQTVYANGLTVEPFEKKLYWVDPGRTVRIGGKLQRCNLDGTKAEDVLTGLLEPTGLALDPNEKTIYWVEGYPPRVRSVNFDGSNMKTLVSGASTKRDDNYWDIVFDKPSEKLYVISRAAISSCNRDGSNLKRLFATGGDCLKIIRGASSPEPIPLAKRPAANWKLVQSIDGASGYDLVYGIALSPDGKLFAAGDASHGMRLWDVDTGKMQQNFPNRSSAATEQVNPVFLKDGKRFLFVWTRHHLVQIYGVDNDKPLTVFPNDPNTHFTAMAAINSNEDLLATSGENGIVTLWSVQTAKPIRRIEHGFAGTKFPGPIVAFCADGKRMACGSQDSKVISICDCSTGQKVGTLSGHTENVLAIAVGREGKIIATTGRDGTIRIWSVSSCKQLRQIVVENASIKCLAMSSDERLIAAGLDDGSVVVWDSENGRQLNVLKTNLNHTHLVTFSLDGRRLAASGDWAKHQIWQAEF